MLAPIALFTVLFSATAALAAGPNVTLPTVLVYSRTAGYRHASIPVAIDTIRTLGSGLYDASFSENASTFTDEALAKYDGIAFLSNSDRILDDKGLGALGRWLVGGNSSRGLIGIHSATTALIDVPFYGRALGTSFCYHPQFQNITLAVTDAHHPSTSALPSRWSYPEEPYNWNTDPRQTNVTVLLSVDSDSVVDPSLGSTGCSQGPKPHPIAWYRKGGIDLDWKNGSGRMRGKMWYTGLGHANETWADPMFQSHVLGGFRWVLGIEDKVNATSSVVATTSANETSSTAAANAPSATSARSSAPTLRSLAMSVILIPVAAVALI